MIISGRLFHIFITVSWKLSFVILMYAVVEIVYSCVLG